IFRKRALTHTEDGVAHAEASDVRADLDHGAGEVSAEHGVFGSEEAETHEAHQVRAPGHEVPGAAVDARRMHAHEHLAGARSWTLRGAGAQNFGAAVAGLEDGSHRLGARECGRSRWGFRAGF